MLYCIRPLGTDDHLLHGDLMGVMQANLSQEDRSFKVILTGFRAGEVGRRGNCFPAADAAGVQIPQDGTPELWRSGPWGRSVSSWFTRGMKWDQSQTVKCSDLSLYPPRAFLTPIRFPSRKCSDVLKKLGGRGLPRVVPLASHRRSGGWVGPGCCREPAWDMRVIPREPWHPDLHPEPLTSSVCVCGPLTKGKLHATPLHSGVWSLEQVGGF